MIQIFLSNKNRLCLLTGCGLVSATCYFGIRGIGYAVLGLTTKNEYGHMPWAPVYICTMIATKFAFEKFANIPSVSSALDQTFKAKSNPYLSFTVVTLSLLASHLAANAFEKSCGQCV